MVLFTKVCDETELEDSRLFYWRPLASFRTSARASL